jgi:cytochrome c oxidase subunit 3
VSNAVAQTEPTLLVQFDDLQQQDETTKLGMWTFLATEVMFFGGMFLAYILYRWKYHSGFALGSNLLYMYAGFLNTGVLLVSSLTMAIAVDEAKLRNHKKVIKLLLITMALGSIFLGVKAVEYTIDYKESLIPGFKFYPPELTEKLTEAVEKRLGPTGAGVMTEEVVKQTVHGELKKVELFFFIYFAMTGLHALHMVIGIATLGTLAFLIHRSQFSDGATVESVGLYWHFVDLVWVFLFPLLYLIDLNYKPH